MSSAERRLRRSPLGLGVAKLQAEVEQLQSVLGAVIREVREKFKEYDDQLEAVDEWLKTQEEAQSLRSTTPDQKPGS